MDVVRLLGLLRPHLDTCGARWMLAGGFALAAYGSTRATADLDLVVDDGVREELLRRLAGEGFEAVFTSEGFTNLLHPDTALGRLDLIWVEGETSRRLFAASRERPLPGGPSVPVPAPEHLVEMKVRAIRNRPTRVFRDGEDLRRLLALDGIDQNAAREAFVRAGLVDLWERLRG
ncbi:MAG: nucleotidyl transferase AbiEii/AbiGii toxin family protein [Thermoanaerobaculia bacterium]